MTPHTYERMYRWMTAEPSKPRTPSGYKGRHHIGSSREQVHRVFDAKGKEAALAFAERKSIKPGTAKAWVRDFAKSAKAAPPARISIRDLQKISGESIRELAGPTPIKSGETTVALLIPLKVADPDRLAAVLARAEALAKGRDAARDDQALAAFGDVDPVDWSVEEVRRLMSGTR